MSEKYVGNLDSDSENEVSENEAPELTKPQKSVSKKRTFDALAEESDSDSDEETEPKEQKEDSEEKPDALNEEDLKDLHQSSSLYKGIDKSQLSKEKIEKIEKRLKKTGVVYISKVPPYMKPTKMRQILERFGKVDRLFLKPETQAQHQKRVKHGLGNRKRMYTEGWAEFLNKLDAKLCVHTLNGEKIGGKKGNFYYDDILNLKYLHGFKWMDLTSQMAKENEARASKLMLEISTATKMNKEYIKNVEKSKMVANMKKRKENKD